MENQSSARPASALEDARVAGTRGSPGIRRAFFFAPLEDRPDRTPYPHAVIALAEGLSPMGVEFYADRPYWQIAPGLTKTLFRYDPEVNAEDCDVVFIDRDLLKFRKDLDLHAIRLRAHKAIYVLVDQTDLAEQSLKDSARLYAEFDLVLKSHCYEGMHCEDKCVPWPFGLAARQLKECEPQGEYEERRHVMRVNFRHTPLTHAVRLDVGAKLFPLMKDVLPAEMQFPEQASEAAYGELMWRQTGRRHQTSYFEDMRRVKACAAFGGWFVPKAAPLPIPVFWLGYQMLRKTGMRSGRIAQWDSWRLWEAMSCGTVAVHVDFERYGMRFPEAPKNGVHYLGVDLDKPQRFLELLADDPGRLKAVSYQGRAWALENYSPEATARRFLRLLGEQVSQDAAVSSEQVMAQGVALH